MYKLRTVVLEDEDNIRNWLVKKLHQYTELDVVGEAATLDDAFRLIVHSKPDAAFVDIQLIGGDVFSLLHRLQENGIPIPHIVITTGYPEFVMDALNDYRRFVVQYLVKPFVDDWQTKLRKAVDTLVAARLNVKPAMPEPKGPETLQSIFINNRGNLDRLDFDKIAYFEAAGGGETYVVTDTETHQIDLTLSKFLELLPVERFQRISKTNIINSARILRVNREDRTVDIQQGGKHKSLGVGDTYYVEMLKSLPVAREAGARPVVAKKPAEQALVFDREPGLRSPSGREGKNESAPEHSQEHENLLHQILPAGVAEELQHTGRVKAKLFDLVTLLFCDLHYCSGTADLPSPEELLRDIDFCFRHLDDIVEKQSLEKIKTLGNRYLCAGGLFKADDDHPLWVVQAAIKMQHFLQEMKVERQSRQLPWFEARMGIHSGPVVAGVVGQWKFTYDIWGPTVDIADHIERMAAMGKIHLSETTYQYIKRHFACRYAGTVKPEKLAEVEVYSIEPG